MAIRHVEKTVLKVQDHVMVKNMQRAFDEVRGVSKKGPKTKTGVLKTGTGKISVASSVKQTGEKGKRRLLNIPKEK
jgi:predicted NUDIX family NTP pyrophosphohydrolase